MSTNIDDIIGVNEVNLYECRQCGKTVQRESSKQWIKSYCDETGKNVRLRLVKSNIKE